MTTTNANVPSAALRRLMPWAAIVLSVATGFASGLWTAQSFSLPARGTPPAVAAKADPGAAAAAEATTWPIVPSPVIEPRPQFFYGTGDGNGSYVGP